MCIRDRVNGVLVAHVLGDYFSQRYGVLAHPVRVEIRDSRATRVACGQPGIAEELERYLDSAENGRRVGEFAIGTNVALTQLVGNLLQDEKIPGVHLAFGHPYPEETGARWASPVHVDAVAPFCTVDVDGRRLLEEGRFLGLPPDMAASLYGS
jgi:leucyl aminopeptidase (aminopeptidase T)